MTKLLILLLLLPSLVPADGGAVILRQDTASFTITVFAAPVPVRTGKADVSILVQKKETLEPVLDISLALLIDGQTIRATHATAQNKLLYAATVDFGTAGTLPWSVRTGRDEQVSGTLAVLPSGEKPADWVRFVIPAPLGILLFVLHQYLAGNRKQSAILTTS